MPTLNQLIQTKPQVAERPVFSKDERLSLGKMAFKLFDNWGIDVATQAELLGLASESRTSVYRYKKGQPLPNSRDMLDRVSHLFGINSNLRTLYPHDLELVHSWPVLRNQTLDNRTPLEIMVEHGLPGIVAIRHYLDHLRGL